VARAVEPDLIPNEVGCVLPEPTEPFVERQPPLFLCESELIHAKRDMLGFRTPVKILEIHDFSLLEDSSEWQLLGLIWLVRRRQPPWAGEP
jgi:hypothetical protein